MVQKGGLSTLYLIAYLLNVFDATATWLWFIHYGIEIELNPIGRWLLKTGFMWVFKLVLVGWMLLFLYDNRDTTISVVGAWVVLILYACICVQHVLLFIVTR